MYNTISFWKLLISFMTGVMNFEGDSKIMYYWLFGKSESFFKKVFQKQFFKQEKVYHFSTKTELSRSTGS